MTIGRTTALASLLVVGACSDDPSDKVTCKTVGADPCIQVKGGDEKALADAANTIDAGTTIVLGTGTFEMTNSLTIRTPGTHVIGQGIDKTILDFKTTTAQVNGVDVIGDDFLIQDLTVSNSPKDGIRVEASSGVVYRQIKVTWDNPSQSSNGGYGIYPVKSQNVLVEGSEASNASDAGLYVGQCQHVIVRDNTVTGNVAGLEIENTEYADVYNNVAENNTAGIVAFDLPGNPIVGRDTRIHDNMIRTNNHPNFADGGTVSKIPVGTGTFAMASRRVEITNNTYDSNRTIDIALISGLALEQDTTKWELPTASLTGDWQDLGLPAGATAGTVMNFRSWNIVVANNTHTGSGKQPDTSDPLQLGLLLILAYNGQPVDSVLYDTIGESKFDSTTAASNSNDNHMCIGGNTGGTFASANLAVQSASNIVPFFRPAAPFVPFDCTALDGGPVAPVVLP